MKVREENGHSNADTHTEVVAVNETNVAFKLEGKERGREREGHQFETK